MEEDEELYDDTVPNETYNEPVTWSSQAEGETRGNQASGGPRTAEQANTTNVRPTRQKTNPLKRQSQDIVMTTEAPVSQDTIEIPSTQGLYYFDGRTFTEHRPREAAIYAPGSDYCHVTNPKNSDGSEYEFDTSTSDSSQEDVKVHSSLSSGLQTLNINISLNVADLVKNTLSGRKGRKKTRAKKAQRLQTLKLSNYEIVDAPDGGGVETGTENQSASLEKELDENSGKNIEKLPPRRPMKLSPTVTSMAAAKSKVSSKNNQEREEGEIYEFANAIKTEEKVLKSYHSVPAFLASQGATGSTNDGSDHPYAKVGDSAHELYSSDLQIQIEVKRLLDNQDWCYVYTNRQAAETTLSDEKSPDGSFAVICEDIEENHHFPFTLLLKYHGKVTRTPIKKVQEYRKKKYELLNVKKDTIEKLIKHFKEKPLPDYKLKLR